MKKYSTTNEFTAGSFNKEWEGKKKSSDSSSVWDSLIIILHKEFINPLLFPLSEVSR